MTGLNEWLQKNGYPTEDPDHMKYFVENGFTFLCVKVSPAEGSKAVESFGKLPPLHLSFRSEKMYYPLRFSSRQGAFDLQLVTLTEKPIDYRASAESLRQLGWNDRSHRRNVGVSTGDLPPELLSLVLIGSMVSESRTGTSI